MNGPLPNENTRTRSTTLFAPATSQPAGILRKRRRVPVGIGLLMVSATLFAGPSEDQQQKETAADSMEDPDSSDQSRKDEKPAANPASGKAASSGQQWRTILLPGPFTHDWYDTVQEKKSRLPFHLEAGAWHFMNVNRDTGEFTYGFPGLEGTYWWELKGDVGFAPSSEWLKKLDFHTEVRFRDKTRFRPFLDSKVWLYEMYGNFQTDYGDFKVGKIWNRFGLDWDGSFWGNVPYFDGQKLDPDWGLSWEQTWKPNQPFSVDSFLQFNFREDGVNGSIAGGGAESSDIFDEENTLIARAVPRWRLTDNASLAVGVSGKVGNIDSKIGPDETLKAWAADATFDWGNLKIYGEILQSFGVLNPVHYVTLGPVDEYTDTLVGVQYRVGPFTLRATFSHGEYNGEGQAADGDQNLRLFGITIPLTRYVDYYFEYVSWDVQADGQPGVEFEDGFQFIFRWKL